VDALRAAVIQMNSRADRAANLASAAELVAEAASRGARLIVLPEKFDLLGGPDVLSAGAQDDDGETPAFLSEQARRHGVWLVGGSYVARRAGRERHANTSVVVDPDGAIVARYVKLHLFDVVVDGVAYRESEVEEPGDEVVAAAGPEPWRVGLSICYDVRFPELYRALSADGASVLTVPAAFTATTGAAHWHVLLRARAIENQAFVLAAGQCGEWGPGRRSFGHSLIADPWGEILAECDGESPGVAVADLDLARLREIRRTLPALDHRRPDLAGSRPQPVSYH
jgi:nitrilase